MLELPSPAVLPPSLLALPDVLDEPSPVAVVVPSVVPAVVLAVVPAVVLAEPSSDAAVDESPTVALVEDALPLPPVLPASPDPPPLPDESNEHANTSTSAEPRREPWKKVTRPFTAGSRPTVNRGPYPG